MDLPTPHLALTHEGPIDLAFMDEFRSAVAVEGLNLRVEPAISTRAMASWPLLMGTTVVVWVFKAYFNGFLEETGKAHAATLNAAVKRLGRRLVGLRAARITARGPVRGEDRFSLIYSIWTERREGGRFKMLVPNGVTEAGLEAALDAYLVFAEAYHTDVLESEDLAVLAEARPIGGVVLLAYDAASGTIQLVDPLEERGG